MAPTTKEVPMEWGVLWQAAVLPDDGSIPPPPVMPTRPDGLPLPTYDVNTGNPTPPVYTPEQQAIQDQYVADLNAYNEAVAAREAVIDEVLADNRNWTVALSVLPDEENARAALKTLIEAHAGNKYARQFELATAPSRIWTAEVE